MTFYMVEYHVACRMDVADYKHDNFVSNENQNICTDMLGIERAERLWL